MDRVAAGSVVADSTRGDVVLLGPLHEPSRLYHLCYKFSVSAVSRSHAIRISSPVCYSAYAGTGHFCPPLTVARKFRLCLHPIKDAPCPVVTPSLLGLARRYLSKEF